MKAEYDVTALAAQVDTIDFKVSNVYIYTVKVFKLHENEILLAIYNY